jgi:COMPASS component SWD3
MKAGKTTELPGHSNRVFAVKFDYKDDNVLYSGGWDDCVYIHDLRESCAVGVIPGPHVCGEAIDVIDNLLVAGSYRNQKNLILVDLR